MTPNDKSETPEWEEMYYAMKAGRDSANVELTDLRAKLTEAQRERDDNHALAQSYSERHKEAVAERDQLRAEAERLTKERDDENDRANQTGIYWAQTTAERDALASHVAELQRDRERLDCLEKHKADVLFNDSLKHYSVSKKYGAWFCCGTLRPAIDAAMQAKGDQ